MTDVDIAHRLGRTWQPFFQRFGRLTEVQRRAIPPILHGKNVLVTSPSASGKTEAVCAPLMERYMAMRGGFKILYICPTRALVNDLYARLSPPLAVLNKNVVRQTAEHRQGYSSDPTIIITTPESTDSMLCRGRAADNGDHILANVKAVVLDEIHLLDGTSRGEQIIWLIRRLRKLKGYYHGRGIIRDPSLQVLALSATISDTSGVMARYLNESSTLVRVGTQRSIESVTCDSASMHVKSMLEYYISREDSDNKILVFCNSRSEVDHLTGYFAPSAERYGYVVRAHHGSMARQLREQTEEEAQTCSRIIIFTTSTLEIGIDIGDIDLVVFNGPPPDLQAYLQRIGRGNRRTNETRVMVCANTPVDLLVQSAMFRAARDGWFPSVKVGRSYTVLKQQVASYIYQNPHRERSKENVEALFSDGTIPRTVISDIIDNMLSMGELVIRHGKLTLGRRWFEESQNRGGIHSTIEGRGGMSVVDRRTGKTLLFGVTEIAGDSLNINGENARIVSVGDFKTEVLRTAENEESRGEVRYISTGGPGTSTHPLLIRHYLGLGDGLWPYIHMKDAHHVFHLSGPSMCLFVKLIAAKGWLSDVGLTDVNEWYMTFDRDPGIVSRTLDRFDPAELVNDGDLSTCENILGRPPSNRNMPPNLRREELLTWFDPCDEVDAYRRSRWVRPKGERITSILENLVNYRG